MLLQCGMHVHSMISELLPCADASFHTAQGSPHDAAQLAGRRDGHMMGVHSVSDLLPLHPHAQERSLTDGAGAKPGYNLRTLCRALEYARLALPVYGLQRSLYDGAAMAFLTQLAPASAPVLERLLAQHLLGGGAAQLKVPATSCWHQCAVCTRF